MGMGSRWMAGLLAVTLAACDGEPMFGIGDKESPPPPDPAADRSIDLAGADQPADLATTDAAARASVATTRSVRAVAILFDELGGAVGDLFPSEDHPCPDGGSASGDLSGSISHPRLRMQFDHCVRSDYTLDGVATIICDDFDGSSCRAGRATLGDGGDVLFFESRKGTFPHRSVTRGEAMLTSDPDAQALHVTATLDGELRSLSHDRRFGFTLQGLVVDVHKTGDGVAEVRLDGVSGIGAASADMNCAAGRVDTQTPQEPLVVDHDVLRSGRLRHSSPPPRPGTQQADAAYLDDGADVTAADGSEQVYSAAQLAQMCAL
jgi:hypothetical protein